MTSLKNLKIISLVLLLSCFGNAAIAAPVHITGPSTDETLYLVHCERLLRGRKASRASALISPAIQHLHKSTVYQVHPRMLPQALARLGLETSDQAIAPGLYGEAHGHFDFNPKAIHVEWSDGELRILRANKFLARFAVSLPILDVRTWRRLSLNEASFKKLTQGGRPPETSQSAPRSGIVLAESDVDRTILEFEYNPTVIRYVFALDVPCERLNEYVESLHSANFAHDHYVLAKNGVMCRLGLLSGFWLTHDR